MNCDNVVEITLMLASGELVTASRDVNADLYWAVRGGTGNNFGILLDATYALHPLDDVWGYRVQWGIEHAAAVLQALQDDYTKDGAPDQLGYLAGLVRDPRGAPVVVMMGIFDGSEDAGRRALAPLLRIGDASLQLGETGPYARINDLVQEKPYCIPSLDPGQTMFAARSRYVERRLGPEAWEAVVDYFLTAENRGTFVCIEPYGGAIASVPADACAFDHRSAYMNVWASAYFGVPSEYPAAQAWTAGLIDRLLGRFGDRVYQNYPNRDTPDFENAYWGPDVSARLRAIKRSRDPNGVFTFEQSL